MNYIGFLLIGLAAGWLAGQILKGRGFGIVRDIIIGVIGSFIGGTLFNLLGFGTDNVLQSLIAATVGAILLILGLRLLFKGKL
jgi:uncharacterized membrane protein YeaQ/YmgE (transglycosylase-associated protein family)